MFLTHSGEVYGLKSKIDLFSGNAKDIIRGVVNTHFALVDENDDIYTWGWGDFGQLGLGDSKSKSIPTPIEKSRFNNEKVVQLRLGFKNSIALTQNNNIYIWGCNDKGKIGLGDNYKDCEQLNYPTLMPGSAFDNKKIIQVGIGDQNFHALTKNGEVYSWGSNIRAQLGLGIEDQKVFNKPTLINPDYFNREKVVKIVVGGAHSLTLTKNGNLYTWGNNSKGQLGYWNNDREIAPKKVVFDKKVDDIIDDVIDFSLATVDGELYGWGNGMKKLDLKN